MKAELWRLPFFLVLTFVGLNVFAQNGMLRDFPTDLKGPRPLNLTQLVLGRSCQTMLPYAYSPPCNAAFLAINKEKAFVANGYIGDDYRKVNDYRSLLDAHDEVGLVQKALAEKDAVKAQAGAALWVQAKQFTLSYMPLYVDFYNLNRNRAYPEVGLHVSQEKTLAGQYGFRFDSAPYLMWGLQTRYVERRFVHQELALLDYLSNPEVLRIQDQKSLYIEPSLVYFAPGDWRFRTTAQVSNWGFGLSGERDGSDVGPFFDLGIGLTPPLGWGDWDVGLTYSFDQNIPANSSRLRLGTAYNLGLVSALIGYQTDDMSFGIISSFMAARVGVSYRHQRILDFDGVKKDRSAAYVEFSLVL